MSLPIEQGSTASKANHHLKRRFVPVPKEVDIQYQKDSKAYTRRLEADRVRLDKWDSIENAIVTNNDEDAHSIFMALSFFDCTALRFIELAEAERLYRNYYTTTAMKLDPIFYRHKDEAQTSLTDISMWDIYENKESLLIEHPVDILRFFITHQNQETIDDMRQNKLFPENKLRHLDEMAAAFSKLPYLPGILPDLRRKYPQLTFDLVKSTIEMSDYMSKAFRNGLAILYSPESPYFPEIKSLYDTFSASGNELQQFIANTLLVGGYPDSTARDSYRKADQLIRKGKETEFYRRIQQVIGSTYDGILGEEIPQLFNTTQQSEIDKDKADHIELTQKELIPLLKKSRTEITIPLDEIPLDLTNAMASVSLRIDKQKKKVSTTLIVKVTNESSDEPTTIEVSINEGSIDWNLLRTTDELPELFNTLLIIADTSLSIALTKSRAQIVTPKSNNKERPVKKIRYADIVYQMKKQRQAETVEEATSINTIFSEGDSLRRYEILFVASDFPSATAEQIKTAIERYNNGSGSIKKLIDTGDPKFRLRSGDLRIILVPDDEGKLRISAIEKRDKAYRRH